MKELTRDRRDGSAVKGPRMSGKRLAFKMKTLHPLPPLAEQRRIVAELGSRRPCGCSFRVIAFGFAFPARIMSALAECWRACRMAKPLGSSAEARKSRFSMSYPTGMRCVRSTAIQHEPSVSCESSGLIRSRG